MSYLWKGPAVFRTWHVKTRTRASGLFPRVYVCVGCFYAVFVIPADGNRQRPEFRTGKGGFVGGPGAVTAGVRVYRTPLTFYRPGTAQTSCWWGFFFQDDTTATHKEDDEGE